MKRILCLLSFIGISACTSNPTVYSQAPAQQLILDKQVASLTRNEVINGVTECQGAGLRAVVVTTKRSINGFTTDIPVEVTCMPRYQY